jgi:hypothetical protein
MQVAALSAAVAIVPAQAATAGSDPQSLAGLARAKGLTGFGNAIGGADVPAAPSATLARVRSSCVNATF